jgi:hypothetical protein
MKQNLRKPEIPSFQRNGFYESIIEMRNKDPRTFDELSPATKLTLAYYEAAKRKALREDEQAA